MTARESDSLREHVDALQRQVTKLKDSADRAREETSEQVKVRAAHANAELAGQRELAREKVSQGSERAQSQWQAMKADAAAKMQGMRDRIQRKNDELDTKMARQDAEVAEDEAVDALDYAGWVVGEAELAVLDAIDARAWASERAAATGTS